MTQEELDALINAENLDEILENFEEKKEEKDEHIEMVGQLNSVTTDSEVKATQVTQKLEQILNEVDAIKICLEKNELDKANFILDDIKNIVFDSINFMQYQDIHRQKIERVINKLIETNNISEEDLRKIGLNIAGSAKHIDGDNNEVLNNDDIDELIKNFSN